MKSFKYLAGAAALVLMLVFACTGKEGDKSDATDSKDSTSKVIPVRTTEIGLKAVPRTLEYTANLIAFKEINFAPASPGRVNKIHVEVGARVSKGQLLVEMDKTQLMQTKLQYENVKTTFERIDTLYQLGSISESQYDQTKSQYEILKTSYEFMKENTSLRSPINGLVTGKYFEDGELYGAMPNTQAGKAAVLTLMQINPLKAIVSVSQSNFGAVEEGMPVEITTDMKPGKVFKASVYKVHPTISAASRTFQTEILINNPGEVLRPGMFANIEIKRTEEDALVVPSIAVLKQEGTNNRYVFLHEEGLAKKIEVTLGKRFDDQIEISGDGIEEGAELIVEGQSKLLDGTKIKVVQE